MNVFPVLFVILFGALVTIAINGHSASGQHLQVDEQTLANEFTFGKMFDCWNKNGNGPSFSNLIKNTDVFCRKTKNDENQEITELRIFSLAFKDNHYLPKAFVEHHMINAASIVLNSKKDWPDTLIQAGFHFSAKHVVTKDQESGIHRIMIISTMKIYSFYWEMNFLANYNCFRLNFIQSLSQPDAFKLQKWKLEEKVKIFEMDVNYAESTDTTYFVESNVLLVDKKKLSVVVQCVLRETELGKCEENALNDTVLKMLHWIKKLSALYELKKENIKSEVGYQDIKETKVLILRLAILLP